MTGSDALKIWTIWTFETTSNKGFGLDMPEIPVRFVIVLQTQTKNANTTCIATC